MAKDSTPSPKAGSDISPDSTWLTPSEIASLQKDLGQRVATGKARREAKAASEASSSQDAHPADEPASSGPSL